MPDIRVQFTPHRNSFLVVSSNLNKGGGGASVCPPPPPPPRGPRWSPFPRKQVRAAVSPRLRRTEVTITGKECRKLFSFPSAYGRVCVCVRACVRAFREIRLQHSLPRVGVVKTRGGAGGAGRSPLLSSGWCGKSSHLERDASGKSRSPPSSLTSTPDQLTFHFGWRSTTEIIFNYRA